MLYLTVHLGDTVVLEDAGREIRVTVLAIHRARSTRQPYKVSLGLTADRNIRIDRTEIYLARQAAHALAGHPPVPTWEEIKHAAQAQLASAQASRLPAGRPAVEVNPPAVQPPADSAGPASPLAEQISDAGVCGLAGRAAEGGGG